MEERGALAGSACDMLWAETSVVLPVIHDCGILALAVFGVAIRPKAPLQTAHVSPARSVSRGPVLAPLLCNVTPLKEILQ